MAKLIAAKCPTCGAGLTVPPGAAQVQCRYCGNTISIEMRKAPPPRPFGGPGPLPSRTLYLDPDAAAAAGKGVAAVMFVGIAVPLVAGAIALLFTVRGASGPGPIGGARKATYPATCGLNETIELSGDWEGGGPAITEVATNCKIKVKNAHIKAQRLVESTGVNMEVTLEDVVLETPLAAITGGTNTKVRITGGSIRSGDEVIASTGANLEVTLTNTTLTSTNAIAIEGGTNLTLTATGGAIKGLKHGAIRADTNAKLTTRSTEISGMGAALQAKSNCTVDASGGELTSQTSAAIDVDSNANLAFEGTTVRGVAAAVHATGNLKVRASTKATLIATQGPGIDAMSSFDLHLDDASIEGARAAVNVTNAAHAKLLAGSRLTGANGGFVAQGNLDLDATNATFEGGKGAGISAASNAKVELHGGVVRGAPAVAFATKPSVFEVDGAKLEGGEKVGR